MKQFFIAVFILTTLFSFSQNSQKKYKYVIVPLQYSFSSSPNEFQLNILTRVMLKEEGFEVYMSEGEQMPDVLSQNKCLALKANVIDDKGLLSTKLRFQLVNCYGKVVYESAGSSRLKAYKKAYGEALREALTVFQTESIKYVKTSYDEDESDVIVEDEAMDLTEQSFEDIASAYVLKNNPFWMVQKGEDYILYSDKGNTVTATLKFIERGSYSYDSENIDGAAYFTPQGDLIVEYLAKNEDAVQKIIYKRQ